MSCGNNQDYWFIQPADSNFYPDITDNSNLHHVGINTTNPAYDLDVNGNTQTTNLIVNGLIQSSNILNTGVIQTDDIIASNILTCNVDTRLLHIYSSNLSSNVALSNFHHLMWMNGYTMSEPFPNTGNLDIDWWFNTERSNAPIHPSWIQDDGNILSDLWSAAELGIDTLEILTEMGQFFDPAQSTIPANLANALADALSGGNDDPTSTDSNSVYVSWSNLIDKPIAIDNSLVGLKGDIYLDEARSIYSLNSAFLTPQGRNNLKVISTVGRDKLIDIGTKDFFPNSVVWGNSNIWLNASNTDFKIQNWNFSASSITCTNQNTYYQNRIYFSSNVSALAVNTNQVFSDSNGYLWWQASNVQLKFQDTSSAIPEQYQSSFLTQSASVLNFKTKDSTFNYGSSNAPQITQLSIDSNGCLYVASNILTNNQLTLRCASNDVFNVYQEGQVRMEANAFRFYNQSNYNNSNYERVIFSVNSNGLFLIDRSSVFGKYEYLTDPFLLTTYSNFPRLDVTLQSGLVFGSGLSSNIYLANCNVDFFTATRFGEIYTFASDCNQSYLTINSNAEIQKGTLRIDKWGGIKSAGSNLCLSNGTFVRSNVSYFPNGNITNTTSGNLLYNASNETLSCKYLGIGLSNPNKDFQIYSVSNECGVRIQSGAGVNQSQLYITGKDNNQSSIGFYNKPLIMGRLTNGNDVSGSTLKTMVFAINDNIGINKLTPSYNLDIAGSFNACNIYENSNLLTDKYASKSNFTSLSNYTYNLTLSNTFTTCNIVANEVNAGGSILGAAGLAFAGAGGVGTAYLLNQQGQLSSILQDALTTGSKISIDPTTGLCYASFGNFANGAKFGSASIYLSNNQILFTSNTTSNMVLGSNSLMVYNGLPFTITSDVNVIGNISLSNNQVLEFGKNVAGKEVSAGKIAYQVFTSNSLDIVGAGSNAGSRNIQLFDNLNVYSKISESNVLLSTKYAPSNTLSNYVLTATGNSQYAPSNNPYLLNPSSQTMVVNASPGGVLTGMLVNNSNINFGSGAGITLQTGGNWGAKLYEDAEGDGNYFKIDLTHATSAYSNAFYVKNNSGSITGQIGKMSVSDFGLGSSYIGISHCNIGNSNNYGFLQSSSGSTFINAPTGQAVKICVNNTPILYSDPTTSNSVYLYGKMKINTSGNIGCKDRLQINHGDLGSSSTGAWSFDSADSNFNLSYLPDQTNESVFTHVLDVDIATKRLTMGGGGILVTGYTAYTGSYGYLSSTGTTGTASGTNNYSIKANYRISGSEINATSDERAKEEIMPFDSELCYNLINQLEQKHYKLKSDGLYKVGVIAQDVEKIFPNCVYQSEQGDIPDFRTIDHSQITCLLIGAVKYLSNEVNELKNEIKELKNKI